MPKGPAGRGCCTEEDEIADTPQIGGGSWNATQWSEVKKGGTLSKLAEQFHIPSKSKKLPRASPGRRSTLRDAASA